MKEPEDTVRKIVGAAELAGVLFLAACSGSGTPVDESLQKDLDLAFTASPITLQQTQPAAQVVSAIERTAPQAKQRMASQRVVRHTPARVVRKAPVEIAEAEVTDEVERAPAASPISSSCCGSA